MVIEKEREVSVMFEVVMVIEGEEYSYGVYSDQNKANEVAIWRRDEDTYTYVRKVEG